MRSDAYLRMFDIFEVHAPRRPAWRWGAYRDTGLFVCLSYEREPLRALSQERGEWRE